MMDLDEWVELVVYGLQLTCSAIVIMVILAGGAVLSWLVGATVLWLLT